MSRTDPRVRDNARASKQMKDLEDIEKEYFKTGGSTNFIPMISNIQHISFKNLEPSRIRTINLPSPQ